MKKLLRYFWSWDCLLVFALIETVKFFPGFIETWYSTGLFPFISRFERRLLGHLPFSAGDVMVAAFMLWVVYKLLKLLWHLRNNRLTKAMLAKTARKMMVGFTIFCVWFYLGWGFNYYRLGSSHQLKLPLAAYTVADVDTLALTLNKRLVTLCRDSALLQQAAGLPVSFFQEQAIKGYQKTAVEFPFLAYEHPSIKPTLLGSGLNYFGTLGYANPLTGEAQINYSMPRFLWPYTLCHEMAHQMGYASETEANLVGYLACKNSGSPQFQYSVYASLQVYAINELYLGDSLMGLQRKAEIPAYLIRERKRARAFFSRYDNPFDPLIYWVYDNYLKANNQAMGQLSYNRVVAWLIAYAKKYGWQNI